MTVYTFIKKKEDNHEMTHEEMLEEAARREQEAEEEKKKEAIKAKVSDCFIFHQTSVSYAIMELVNAKYLWHRNYWIFKGVWSLLNFPYYF